MAKQTKGWIEIDPMELYRLAQKWDAGRAMRKEDCALQLRMLVDAACLNQLHPTPEPTTKEAP